MKRRKRGGNRDVTDAQAVSAGQSFASAQVRHIPVLLHEMLAALNPKDLERYIDATFGAGGYSRAILDHANCEVLALDRDPSAIEAGRKVAVTFADVIPAQAKHHNNNDPHPNSRPPHPTLSPSGEGLEAIGSSPTEGAALYSPSPLGESAEVYSASPVGVRGNRPQLFLQSPLPPGRGVG